MKLRWVISPSDGLELWGVIEVPPMSEVIRFASFFLLFTGQYIKWAYKLEFQSGLEGIYKQIENINRVIKFHILMVSWLSLRKGTYY